MPSPLFDGLGEIMLETFGDAAPAVFLSQVEDAQPIDVEVIFNDKYQEQDYNGISFGTPKPVAWYRTGTISPAYGDKLTVNSVDYLIRAFDQDGLELTRVDLEKQ